MTNSDSDAPPSYGLRQRLHLLAGNTAIFAANLFRPRLSLGVRLAAFDAEERVFLVRHSYLPGWHLPGGAVEANETARTASVREAGEEGGLALGGPPELFHVYFNPAAGRRDHVVLFVARGACQVTERPPARPEILEAGFFPRHALPGPTTRATRDRIAEVVEGRAPADVW